MMNLPQGHNGANRITTNIHRVPPGRTTLLPRWIRFFCWFFLVSGVVFMPLGLLPSYPPRTVVSFLGLEYVGDRLDWPAWGIHALVALFAISAYGLLWGKSWGVDLGLLVGGLGLLITLGVTLSSGFQKSQIEILFQIPFLITLFRIRDEWKSLK